MYIARHREREDIHCKPVWSALFAVRPAPHETRSAVRAFAVTDRRAGVFRV
jgi:hypothetical protein